jgi:predicted kinase
MLILIRGLPGSGKTTLAKTFVGYHHYESDDYFYGPDGLYRYDGARLADAHCRCFDNTARALAAGDSCVVANTFVTVKELRPYMELARKLGHLIRIIKCTRNGVSIHSVPEGSINAMRNLWENVLGEEKIS